MELKIELPMSLRDFSWLLTREEYDQLLAEIWLQQNQIVRS